MARKGDNPDRKRFRRRDNPDAVVRRILEEVSDTLGRYFVAEDENAENPRLIETFGNGGVIDGTTRMRGRRRRNKDFVMVRWQFEGRHVGTIPPLYADGHDMVRATGNPVVVEGLTVVERQARGREDEYTIRRFVDWLSVYAQLGVVFQGRPVGMSNTKVVAAPVVERIPRPTE